MKILLNERSTAKEITAFNSRNLVMNRIIISNDEIHIGCMFIGAEGVVGYHQATTEQLFIIVEGEGWVKGEEGDEIFVTAGCAALWDAGEWHESKSENGMTAIVIEGPNLKHYLPEKVLY
jgi:mannose-6-phosphate isomerase-like protein (cupin superfamily)